MKGRSSRTGIVAAVALAAGLAFAPRAFPGESLRAVRGGLAMTLRVDSGEDEETKDAPVVAGEIGRIVLEIKEAKSGLRKTGLHPEAWIDFGERPDLGQRGKVGCEKKAGLFQSGGFGTHPLIDLNRYFILTLNDDPTVSVIDPMAGMAGMTKLYTLINLKSPGADWTQSADGRRLFVSMPAAGAVGIADTGTFKMIQTVPAGADPMRLALPPWPGELWVGNDAPDPARSGVTLIRPDGGEKIAEIPTGRGHHEIAFSKARRHLFVSNREEGTVTVIDAERRASIAQIRTGRLPIAIAYSEKAGALFVADGLDGSIAVVDGESFRILSRIKDAPGLGPMRLTPDGGFLLALNTSQGSLLVIDPPTKKILWRLAVDRQPFQIAFTQTYAYIRSLETEFVSLVRLDLLGRASPPAVAHVAVGAAVGGRFAPVSLADTIVAAPGEAAAMMVNRADQTVYYYMEGMAVPMGSFRTYGHKPNGVGVIDRVLREDAPGLFSAPVQFPVAGTYELILRLRNPDLLHCFRFRVGPNPSEEERVEVEYLNEIGGAQVGDTVELKFRLVEVKSRKVLATSEKVQMVYYRVPGSGRTPLYAEYLGKGIYRGRFKVTDPGAYYVSASCPSCGSDVSLLTFWSEEKKR